MILDSRIDSLLLLTNACVFFHTVVSFTFFRFGNAKNMTKTIHETQNFCLRFFTNH